MLALYAGHVNPLILIVKLVFYLQMQQKEIKIYFKLKVYKKTSLENLFRISFKLALQPFTTTSGTCNINLPTSGHPM
jgi:hypothetical protein